MLRYKGVEADEPEFCRYRIFNDETPADPETLTRIARIAEVLLAENKLEGSFHVVEPGLLALDLEKARRGFFHNGIVFAALDAVNDPVRNPTLTLRAGDSSV